jgi:hypothetical protein
MSRPVVNPGKVDWSGENHTIQLAEAGTSKYSCMVSFFRVVISPFGRGHAAFVLPGPSDEGKSNACYTDNRSLAEWLLRDFLGHFGPFKSLPALRGLKSVANATFGVEGNSPDSWTEVIKTATSEITLRWLGLGESFMVEMPIDQSPTKKHEMFSLFVPAETGEVIINGERAPGIPVPRQLADRSFSSAFLAFSETWTRHE